MSNPKPPSKTQIEFYCDCGARYRVDAKLAGRQGRCKTCGTIMLIPGNADAAHGDEVVDIRRVCSICQCDIEPDEQVTECPECGLPFHAECWEENFGCSTYGCPQVNALKEGPDLRVGSDQIGEPREEKVWRYAMHGKPQGPVSTRGLDALLKGGRIGVQTRVWRKGMAAWTELRSVPELASLVASRPEPKTPGADIPWEFLLLGGSTLAFLIGLISYGIPSLLTLLGTAVYGGMKLLEDKNALFQRKPVFGAVELSAMHVLGAATGISLVGFVIGLALGGSI